MISIMNREILKTLEIEFAAPETVHDSKRQVIMKGA